MGHLRPVEGATPAWNHLSRRKRAAGRETAANWIAGGNTGGTSQRITRCTRPPVLSAYNRVSRARSLPDLLGPAASKKTCNVGSLSALLPTPTLGSCARSVFPVASIARISAGAFTEKCGIFKGSLFACARPGAWWTRIKRVRTSQTVKNRPLFAVSLINRDNGESRATARSWFTFDREIASCIWITITSMMQENVCRGRFLFEIFDRLKSLLQRKRYWLFLQDLYIYFVWTLYIDNRINEATRPTDQSDRYQIFCSCRWVLKRSKCFWRYELIITFTYLRYSVLILVHYMKYI